MTSHRFEIIPVPEPTRDDLSSQPSEMIPLVNIEHEIPPPPPPLPPSLSSTNGKNNKRIPSRLFGTYLQRKSLDNRRRASIAAALAKKNSSSLDIIPKTESRSAPPRSSVTNGAEGNDSDVYSTTQSNNYDSNPVNITNKFLQELRLKRREFRDKAKNLSIDQRVAFNCQQNARYILRAQDIFDVHFELDDDGNNKSLTENNFFTEETQEKIRKDIYDELNRQRKKHYHKQHRHLLFGRSLLMLMTSLLAFMSFTLIYVVLDIYDRANYLDAKLPENEFVSTVFDKTKDFS